MKVFIKENKKGTPIRSLTITNVATQILLLSTISNSIAEAFSFVITIATLAYLLPYLVTAVFQLKCVFDGSYGDGRERIWNGFIGLVGLTYSVYVIIAATSDISTFLWGVFFISFGIIFSPMILKGRNKDLSKKTILE